RGAVAAGDRVLPGAAAAGQGGVPVQLRRRAARAAQARQPEGLHGADAGVLRPPPARGAAAGADGIGQRVAAAPEGQGRGGAGRAVRPAPDQPALSTLSESGETCLSFPNSCLGTLALRNSVSAPT